MCISVCSCIGSEGGLRSLLTAARGPCTSGSRVWMAGGAVNDCRHVTTSQVISRHVRFSVHNPSGFVFFSPFLFTIRVLFVVKCPQSPPKPRNVPRSPFTLRRRSCPVAQAPFSTRGLREAEEQALPGRAWSPRSVRATSPFGLARRGKDATDPVKTKGFFRRRTTLSKLLVCALTRATQRRRRRLGGCGAAVARTPTR